MAGKKKPTFDQEAAFKSLIGAGQNNSAQAQPGQDVSGTVQETPKETRGKGRPKTAGETKKRVTLALYPSIYGDLQKIAYVKRQSVSEIIAGLITVYINENTDALDEYERIEKEQANPSD